MNNEHYHTADMDEEVSEDAKAELAEVATKVATLRRLIGHKDFKFFLTHILKPRLSSASATLRRGSDPLEVYRAQGAVGELEFIMEGLPKEIQSLTNTIEHAQQTEAEAGT